MAGREGDSSRLFKHVMYISVCIQISASALVTRGVESPGIGVTGNFKAAYMWVL